MSEDIASARAALARISVLGNKICAITRLGGLTNQVFRVETEKGLYCLRLPGAGTSEYINRADEEANARAAAQAGVAPEILYFGDDGVMVTNYLAATETMTPAAFRTTPGAVERAGRLLRTLHDRAAPFASTFDLFAMIDGYLRHLDELGLTTLPDGYKAALRDAERVREALSANPLPQASCHCDPLCENFLNASDRMWIVDWEYAGLNDPMWDIGDLSVEGGFDEEMDRRLLDAYLDGASDPSAAARMSIYKAMCDLLWTLWGLIQHANKNPADDFWSYSVARFERCRALMSKPAFAEALRTVGS